MLARFNEDTVEQATLVWLESLGYEIKHVRKSRRTHRTPNDSSRL